MEEYLLIGQENWLTEEDTTNPTCRWHFAKPGTVQQVMASIAPADEKNGRPGRFSGFAAVYLAAMPTVADCQALAGEVVDAYKVVCPPEIFQQVNDDVHRAFFVTKMVKAVTQPDWPHLRNFITSRLFNGQSGMKMDSPSFEISPTFRGMVEYQGYYGINLEDDFGPNYRPIGTYKWGAYVDPDRTLELWPEYTHSSAVSIRIVVYSCSMHDDKGDAQRLIFDEQAMKEPLVITGPGGETFSSSQLMVCVEARGNGKLTLGDLHYRWSRRGFGTFIAGGERIVGKDRRELAVYFNPGDYQPPLNVYFSGYRMAEGFEGYYMMRGFKAPFILVADPRLEGGAFYLGDADFEAQLENYIIAHLKQLGFDRSQLVCSGMSMGSFGAFYYGSHLGCHGIIVTKPLLNLGRVALAEQQLRFGGFTTSLDILNYHLPDRVKQQGKEAMVAAMDRRLWDRFGQANIDDTKMMLAYMENDDYDLTAYPDLLRHVAAGGKHPHIISRGWPGHHLDHSVEAVIWFQQQFNNLLRDDFGR